MAPHHNQEDEGQHALDDWKSRMESAVKKLTDVVFGEGDEFGLVHRVGVIWQLWVWVLCSASAAAGVIATLIIQALTEAKP